MKDAQAAQGLQQGLGTAEAEARAKFSKIYADNYWGVGSGVGSMPDNTKPYVEFLERFLLEQNVRSIVDFGCGDWQFSRYVQWGDRTYLGVDIVELLIEGHKQNFQTANIRFEPMRDVALLPPADLLICKDVLQHLPNHAVLTYLRAFRKKYKFILITNGVVAEHLKNTNVDIDFGAYRPLRLDSPPFNIPCVVLLEWFITSFGNHYLNQANLILGEPALLDKDLKARRPDLWPRPIPMGTVARRWLDHAPYAARNRVARSPIGTLWRAAKKQARAWAPTRR